MNYREIFLYPKMTSQNMNRMQTVEKIIIHHTERNNDFPLFAKLRHKYLRGWEDVGYHYLIGNKRPFTKDGKIYSGRNETLEGAHTLGQNKNSLGVCLIGNFDKNPPSKKQLESLLSLLKEKISQYKIHIKNIRGHNEFPEVTKSCPGRWTEMNYIRAVISKKEEFSYQKYLQEVKNKIVLPLDEPARI